MHWEVIIMLAIPEVRDSEGSDHGNGRRQVRIFVAISHQDMVG